MYDCVREKEERVNVSKRESVHEFANKEYFLSVVIV